MAPTSDLLRYLYRREFGLSAAELESEPAHEFFLNLKIYALIKDKERIMAEQSGKQSRT